MNVLRNAYQPLLLLLLMLLTLPAHADKAEARQRSGDDQRLYASLVRSRGWVVGTALSGSGMHHRASDTTWVHAGWNHPMIFAIAVDPVDPDVFFLAAGNGAMRSLDGGASWRVTTDWRVTEVMDVDINPANTNNVMIGTAYGIWKTTDRGDTWQQSDDGIAEKYTSALRFDRAAGNVVLAGTLAGIYRSADGGRSWSRVSDARYVTDMQQSAADPDLWVASLHDGGLLISRNGGATFRNSTGAINNEELYGVALDPSDAGRMAVAGFEAGVRVSADGGETWTNRSQGLPLCTALTVVTNPPANPGPCAYEVVFDPQRPGTLIAATVESGIFESTDTGRTWRYIGMDGSVVYDLVFATAPR